MKYIKERVQYMMEYALKMEMSRVVKKWKGENVEGTCKKTH